MSSRTDRVSEVAQEIEQSIVRDRLAPGDRLPAEREISARLGVSRSVVREALNRLASQGLVHSVRGSGTRVERPSMSATAEGFQRLLRRADLPLADLGEVRLPLETAIAALAAQRRTAAHLLRLEKTQRVLGNPRRSLAEHVEADLDFHATLAEATQNPLFGVVLAPIQERLIESRRRTLGQYGAELAHRHHADILAAVRAADADAAAAAMRAHIEANREHLRSFDT
jgi:GntR family transcriptional regulator, transcriptional repressor for pyruvate dehydrogenase complex